MNESALITLAGIGLTALACQWFAWSVKLPAILFLLLAGIVAGPVTGWLDPEALFGDLLFPLVSLSVAVILFEGALTLNFQQIRGLEKVVRNLVTVGIIVTWTIITLITRLALGFEWEICILFGAVTLVTGPTVIVPMLRTVRPNARIANILRWEGIVIDPIGALLAVLVYEFIIAGAGPEGGGGTPFGHTLAAFGQIIGIGTTLGAVAGHSLGVILRRRLMPEYLHNVATLTLVCGVYAISNAFQEESGLLTVTVMGVWIANMKDTPVEEILDFKESLSLLLISVLFIVLAARMEFSQFAQLGVPAVWVFLAIQFVARPAKVLVSTIGSSLKWSERALLGWIAPRGIVAAAVSALFAIRLEGAGYEQAHFIVPLTFMVIIGTVTLQSATSRLIATALGVAEPEPKGFLVIGANIVARAIAKALTERGFQTLLTDTSWNNIKDARMEGLKTFYGHPVSEHADRRLDLVGIGGMLGLSQIGQLNVLSAMRYRNEFGANNIYTLLTSAQKEAGEKHRAAADRSGSPLFGDDVTYSKAASLIGQGAEMRAATLTENFDFEAYKEKNGRKAIPMFAIDPKDRIRVFTASGDTVKPEPGWTVLSLVQPDEDKENRKSGNRNPGAPETKPGNL